MLSVLITKQTNKQKQRNTRKLWEVMDTAITLTVVMITWVFAYVQTHQIVHIKYVQLFMYQLYLNKAINNVH